MEPVMEIYEHRTEVITNIFRQVADTELSFPYFQISFARFTLEFILFHRMKDKKMKH